MPASKAEGGQPLAEMSFWDHIDALRGVILRAGLIVVIFAAAFFVAMPWIFDNIILAPCNGDFPLYRLFARISGASSMLPDFATGDFQVKLINIQLASQFFIHMTTSFWLGVVFAFPAIISLVWGFISPGLYENEKRGVKRAFFFGNTMFFLGVAVGYFLVFPLTLRFLAEYKVSEMVPNQISLDSYMDNFLVLILVMGIIFELPLLAWMLGRMGILTREFFKKFRRHAIAGLLVLAAVVTPTGDPFTLMVVFLPIYALWEMSAWLVPAQQPDDDNDDDAGSDHPDSPSDEDFDRLYIPAYKRHTD